MIFLTIWILLGLATVVIAAASGYLDIEDPEDLGFAALGVVIWPAVWAFALIVLILSGCIVLGKKIGGIK